MSFKRKLLEKIAGSDYIIVDVTDPDDMMKYVKRDIRINVGYKSYESDAQQMKPNFHSTLQNIVEQNELELKNCVYQIQEKKHGYSTKYHLICVLQFEGLLADVVNATKTLSNMTHSATAEVLDTYS